MTTGSGAPNETGYFTRWPGLLSLSIGVLLGPIVALVNELLLYVTNMWACGTGSQLAMHIVPLLCLLAAIGAGTLAYMDWNRVGGGVEDEAATVDSRTRFMALGGMAVSGLSALVIIAQWLTVFAFGACVRA